MGSTAVSSMHVCGEDRRGSAYINSVYMVAWSVAVLKNTWRVLERFAIP